LSETVAVKRKRPAALLLRVDRRVMLGVARGANRQAEAQESRPAGMFIGKRDE